MTGSQKLFVFAGVFLGGLGLALPFRQLSPRGTSVPESEVPRVDDHMAARLSLAIEAGNDANLPSPRGRTPYFGSGSAGLGGEHRGEAPVIEQSPIFHEPRPNDPLPRMGSRYEPLLERRPFRESQREEHEAEEANSSSTFDEEPAKPGELPAASDVPQALFFEAGSATPEAFLSASNPTPSRDVEFVGDRGDGTPPLATLDRDRIRSSMESPGSSSPTWQHPPLAIESQPFHDSEHQQEALPARETNEAAEPSQMPHQADDTAWAASPRLRGWRETQVARASEESGNRRGGRNAPFARCRSYCLRDGDTLPGLAQRFLGSENRYPEILDANRGILRDPQVLPLGVEIRIPYP